MGVDDVLEVVGRLEAAGVEVWLDGGWGVDALLGAEHRPHRDVDVVLRLADADRAVAALAPLGFTVALDERPTRLVLAGTAGRQVDVHPVTFDALGTGWQAGAAAGGADAAYPAEGFTTGRVGGRPVGCIGPALQLVHHQGYPPSEVDRHDVALLCRRFGLAPPRAGVRDEPARG
jgi:lincosamide nucleotidyltransferase A/C/D/E